MYIYTYIQDYTGFIVERCIHTISPVVHTNYYLPKPDPIWEKSVEDLDPDENL